MPTIAKETYRSISKVQQVVSEYIPDPVVQFKFFASLQKSLNINESGKVSFKPHLLHHRRRAVMQMFTGDNYEEVAKSLGIAVDTVKNDVRWHYENAEKKK